MSSGKIIFACLVCVLYVVATEAQTTCDVTKVTKCQSDYLNEIKNLDKDKKETYCGPLAKWDTCRQQYKSTCENNALYKAFDSIYSSMKSVCSGSTTIQFSIWILVAVAMFRTLI